jgi:hypothetical protein
LGLANNTLNTGDDLETKGAATGASTLTYVTTSNMTAANPPFAQGITMNGINTLNITNNNTVAGAGMSVTAGFDGKITGLLVENNTNSVGPVALGATGQGLGTLLTNINISGNAYLLELVTLCWTSDRVGLCAHTCGIGPVFFDQVRDLVGHFLG